MILLLTLVFAIIATAAGMLAADRMLIIVTVSSSASVSELALPIGHWVAVGMWTLSMVGLVPANRRQVIFRCIGVGFALHVLILVALFVPRLDDRAAFSATVYLIYARVFCVMAMALSTAWLYSWVERMRTDSTVMVTLEAPLLAGSVALLIAVVRHHVLMAVAALAIGIAIVITVRLAGTGSLNRAAMIRRLAAEERVFLVVVFLVALALRLLYVTRIMSDANYLDAGADGRIYDELAWSIASGNGIPGSFSDSYPLLLLGHVWLAAGIYSVAGHSYFALTAVQAVLGAAACILLYDLARRLFDRPTATVSAIFAAVSFPLVFAAATIGHQGVDVFLTTLIVWLLMRFRMTSGGAWRWAGAGALVGFAFTVRETNLFLVAFLLPWIAFTHPGGWRRSAPVLVAFGVGAILVVLPFMAPKVWSPAARQGMRAHFDRMYRGLGGSRPTLRPELIGPLEQPQAALAQFRDQPVRVVTTLAREYADNFAVQFLTQPYGGFDLFFLRKGSHYYYGMWFYAYVLTLVGAIVLVRRMPTGGLVASGAVLIIGVIVARTVPHLMLASDYRHRAPLEPLLILLASVAAVAIGHEVIATAASTRTSGFTGSDWRVSHSSGT